jgi:hypothetical protein
MRTTNTNKYPNGYAEKIEYWRNKLNNATTKDEWNNAYDKVQYFAEKQHALNPLEIQSIPPTKLDEKAIYLLIQENEDDYQIKIEKYIRDKDGRYNFLFNWTSGGFNDVWAFSKEEAIKIVARDRKGLKADSSSFRKATKQMSDEQNRMGWMMSI